MRTSLLTLAALTFSGAVASEALYWTDDADLFNQLDLHADFANFTENTRHLSSDGQGFTIEGVMFHENRSSQEHVSLDELEESSSMNLVRRGGVKCKSPQCTGYGPVYQSAVQQTAFGQQACDVIDKLSKTKKGGLVILIGSQATCQGGGKCYLLASFGFSFRNAKLGRELKKNCYSEVKEMAIKCSGAEADHYCTVGPGGPNHRSQLSMIMNAQRKKVTCSDYSGEPSNTHCRTVKCDSKNKNCQTF